MLLQSAYGPGQPTSLVFAAPPPPQMSSAPQPRQVLLAACLLPTFHVSFGIKSFPYKESVSNLITRLTLLLLLYRFG